MGILFFEQFLQLMIHVMGPHIYPVSDVAKSRAT